MIEEIKNIVDGPGSRKAKLQSICRLLTSESHYHWVGFYLADERKRELTLGPYVGDPTEHVTIEYGEGICGQAAASRETLVVQDVSKECNYLSCSNKVKSEIVVPIVKEGVLVGELDIDSHWISPFKDEDRIFLKQVCELVSKLF